MRKKKKTKKLAVGSGYEEKREGKKKRWEACGVTTQKLWDPQVQKFTKMPELCNSVFENTFFFVLCFHCFNSKFLNFE